MILRDMKMGFDVKGMQVCILGVLNLFISSSFTFVKKYPFVSGVLFFFFLLYMFLPSVFTFLIYSVPVLVFIAVAFRLIFRIHQQNLEKAKGEKRNYGISAQKPTAVEDDVVGDKKEHSSIRRLSVKRRNAKEKDERVYVQEGVEEKDMVFRTIPNDALVDKAALIEENPKEIREVMVDSVIDRTESSSAASQWRRHEHGGGSESELGKTNKLNGRGHELEAESSEDGEDEDEEEGPEDGNKAVEWTEDDQKNLMDLGISEIERNKRLESLIARRRARKLLSMQVRRTLMNTGSNDLYGQIASLLIPIRSNQFPPISSGEAQVSPTPGSAPSVLLPMHNPFDLPYDPQEEKPNLTGGSFQEEFMPANQKDMMFCRHESFSLGAFSPGPLEFDQSRSETFYYPNFHSRQRISEIPEYYRLRNQSGKEDPSKLIQTEPFQECRPMLHINSSHDHGRRTASEQLFNLVGHIHYEDDRSEVHKESNLVREATGGSSSSSLSSEVNVLFSAANKEEMPKSLSFSVLKNVAGDRECNADQRNELLYDNSPYNAGQRIELLYDNSPSSFGKKRPEERFFFSDKGVNHTPTHSIASDLQVEVSEVSSPELTIDGTISPEDSDRGSLINYDGDVGGEKETTSGSEEMWVASSQLSRVEENESTSRDVHEVSEQDIIEVGFSRINQKFEAVIVASDTLQEKAVEQDHSIEDTSVLSSKSELPKIIQTHSTHFNGEVHTSYSSEALSSEKMASLTLENAQQSSEISEAHSSHHSNSGKPEGRSDSPEKSAQEANIIYDVNDQVVSANDHKVIFEFIKDTYGEAPVMVEQVTPRDLSILTAEDHIKPVKVTEGNSGVPENYHSNATEYFEGEFIQQSLPGANLIGNTNVQAKIGEQGIVGVGSSGANPNCNDSIALVMQPEIVAEHGPTDSTSSSASTSLTEEKVPISQVSLSNFDQTTQIMVQQIIADVVGDNFLDRPLSGSSKLEPIMFNKGQYEQQGEHQTFLESYKPVEENLNSKSSEDFKAQPGKLANHKDMTAPSEPIEKMGIWEPIQDREFEQGVVDVGFAGVSQSSNDPIPLTMLPELMAEQVPNSLSSSLSPKSDTWKMVSVGQASSPSIEPEMNLKVQKSDGEIVESNLLDKLQPENLAASSPENAQDLSFDSTTYTSHHKDLEELQEPSNSPKKSTEELNSIYVVNDSEVPAIDVMVNMKTIDDIIGKGHLLAKEENSGVHSKISEESTSNSIGGQTILKSHEPIVKNGNLKTFEDCKGEYLELAECDSTPETSNPECCENNNSTLETSQECEQNLVEVRIFEVSPITNATVESGIAGLGQSFINPPNPHPQALFPQVEVEQVPIISRSPSPKSVLQNKFSIDQGSLFSSDHEMEENTMLNGLSPENLAAGVPQNAVHLMEDSMAPLSDSSYSGSLQEPFSPPAESTMEGSVNYINDSASKEKEEKLDSKSPMELFDVTSIEDPRSGLKHMTDNGAAIGTSRPMELDENSGPIKKIEKFGESLIFQGVEDSSMASNIKHNLEATEVVEGKSRTLTAREANVDGMSEPVDKIDVSNICATSEEREEPAKADRGRSIEEEDVNSNDNELVVNMMVGEEDSTSSVGDSEGESQRFIRSVDVAEQ